MLLPVKAVITPKPRRDGNFLIYFQYCFSATNRVLVSSEIAVPKAYWNKKRQCISKSLPAGFGDEPHMNDELSRMLKVIEALIGRGKSEGAPNMGAYVKERFTPSFKIGDLTDVRAAAPKAKKEADFFAQVDDYIASKERKVCAEGLANFRSMKEHLLAYQVHTKKKISFSLLDYNFYEGFVEFLTYDYQLRRKIVPEYGLKTSTIGRTIKKLRMFIKDRVRRKIIAPIDMEDFKILDEATDAVYLSYEEIGRIYAADLSDVPHLIQYRDLFVLGCLTGLRFSDYSTLRYGDLRGGLLYKKTDKMDAWVVIPLRHEAREIFERHFKDRMPKISNPKFNKYVKEICELAGITHQITFSYKRGNKDVVVTKSKAQWVTTHTCRRSFCTNEFLLGTEVALIQKISGHRTQKDFFKYIRIDEEQAARIIQDIWSKRSNMQAFARAI